MSSALTWLHKGRRRRQVPLRRWRSAQRAEAIAVWALVLLCGLATAAGAQLPTEGWRIEPFEWQGRLETGRTLSVHNPYGDVRARRSEGTFVAIYAAMQRHGDDPRPWQISVAESDNGLAVDVVLEKATEPAGGVAAWEPRRVDLTVYVPAKVTLRVETTTGLIEAKRLASRVEARTTRGEIVITTAGDVDARSEEGSIRYSPLDPDPTGSARLATRAGDIALILPRGARFDLVIRTDGEISTDPALAANSQTAPSGETKPLIGAVGGRVVAESESGDVTVRRMPT